ncbi:S8 family peptidase [Halorhodospira halophila]|uniref:Peptidase S8 and S53, subtilisin, kexin, sedolisin n=1 Tax=Halorhodospira halophila (strain DSM 244 / SL1) TaxID=349124 RepID=A1WZL9_HALHL|nr:S8 family peptidase [Halorhodospira halophila]ABM63131.1 peptidase S8 and S53, subtilisin, kexin, sedolisin [Halorhodospira halophila SL1]MBK1729310.1 hypothetical protein [Halorhodospira halophila]
MNRPSRLSLALGGALLLAGPGPVSAPEGAPPNSPSSSAESPQELLVRFAPDVAEGVRTATHRAYGGHTKRRHERGRFEVVPLPPYADREEALRKYRDDPHVEHAEPNRYVERVAAPADAASDANGWWQERIRLTELETAERKAGDTIVGILDTGIQCDHPALADNTWDDGDGQCGKNFIDPDTPPDDDSDRGHGTHVAGIIGANSDEMTGVARSVQLQALKFLGSLDDGTLADAIEAIDYAIEQGTDVLNASYAYTASRTDDGPLPTSCADLADTMEGASRLHCEAVADAGEAGILFVAAAHNSGNDNDTGTVALPAGYPLDNVIAVAASRETAAGEPSDQLADFSNFGRQTVHLAAPGVGIHSTVAGDDYDELSGTSMATPMVAGVAALLLDQAGSEASHLTIRERLLGSVACDRDADPSLPRCDGNPLGDSAGQQLAAKTLSGGRLDAAAALGADPDTVPPVPPSHVSIETASGIPELRWLSSSPTARGYRIERFDTAEGTFRHVATVEPDRDRYRDRSAPSDTLLGYRIRALGSDGQPNSRWTEAGTVETDQALNRVTEQFAGFSSAERDERCFIATAAYGSEQAHQVEALRDFRDDYLMPHPPGRALVAAYYAVSPPIAEWVAAEEHRQRWVRRLLALLPTQKE